ncbi:uncharacterized protein SPAPADRAFT_59437 [Spathaspora passalidarum NRRL Y-27907]|uniref:Uncharacterized protein n=1 Tax=Spathaspora passalidarum (strain NRRL Y-27907 / 11-Y1) TaxID=619300 RepID=G3AJX2_SPAPN|nr:uncharacterized protein SPAPADRAFT_59437 [Spathaspora passalidarum NRRL Y-27907]EGW34023.1 hypothetical protein SPAPADRAFT_59437 [Spathaspora passalidarum NRRL Y-27907]
MAEGLSCEQVWHILFTSKCSSAGFIISYETIDMGGKTLHKWLSFFNVYDSELLNILMKYMQLQFWKPVSYYRC